MIQSWAETASASARHTLAAELPVIMVTARHGSHDIVAALNAGANDYVAKQIDFAVTVARIETQLGRRKAEAALRESEDGAHAGRAGRE